VWSAWRRVGVAVAAGVVASVTLLWDPGVYLLIGVPTSLIVLSELHSRP